MNNTPQAKIDLFCKGVVGGDINQALLAEEQ